MSFKTGLRALGNEFAGKCLSQIVASFQRLSDLSPEQTVFAMDRGTYTARLVGVRDGFALVAVVASDGAQRQTGFDEAIVVRLSDGASSVLVPRAPAVLADGLHTGGWLSAPGG